MKRTRTALGMTSSSATLAKFVAPVAPMTAAFALSFGVSCTEQLPKDQTKTTPTPTPTTVTTTPPTGVVRTVETRSPFGELRTDNLFLDGDFEFTGRNGQMPWLVFKSSGQGVIGFDTGGKCFSGVRCALMKNDDEMVGFVASAGTGSTPTLTFSVVAKTSSGLCKDVSIIVTDLTSGTGGGTIKPPAEPAEDHWCHFEGSVKGYPEGELVLYVTAKTDQVWVDHAVATSAAVKAQPSMAGSAPHAVPDVLPISEEARARIRVLGARIRASRIYGDHSSLVREGKLIDEKPAPKFPN